MFTISNVSSRRQLELGTIAEDKCWSRGWNQVKFWGWIWKCRMLIYGGGTEGDHSKWTEHRPKNERRSTVDCLKLVSRKHNIAVAERRDRDGVYRWRQLQRCEGAVQHNKGCWFYTLFFVKMEANEEIVVGRGIMYFDFFFLRTSRAAELCTRWRQWIDDAGHPARKSYNSPSGNTWEMWQA